MGKCRIRAPEDRDVCTRRANRPVQGESAKERPVAPAYFHAASRCNMLQAMQRGQTALPMHDNIMNRSRACRVGRKWRERNGRGCATREREGRQTDLITIVNGINGISHEGQTRRTRAWCDTIRRLPRIGIVEIKMRLVTRLSRSRPRNDVRLFSPRAMSGAFPQRPT